MWALRGAAALTLAFASVSCEAADRRASSAAASAEAAASQAAPGSTAGSADPATGSEARALQSGPVSAIDDVGREVRLDRPARRVISLLPAATETLVALGAGDRVVARTRYDHERRVAHLPSVGGGLDPDLETLVSLDPDLVVAFETAGGSELRTRLERLGIPVFAIQTQDTADVLRSFQTLGALVGRREAADSLTNAVRAELAAVRAEAPAMRPKVLYVASVDPPMLPGRATFISELILIAGGRLPTLLDRTLGLWPQVSMEAIVREQPDIVVLPVGPDDPTATLRRLRTEPGWRELEAVRQGRVVTVSAELMNRPGPGIGRAAAALRRAISSAADGQ